MKAQDIKAGMTCTLKEGNRVLGGWKATGDAVVEFDSTVGRNQVFVPVLYYDGGWGTRIFELGTEVPMDAIPQQ